MEVFLTIACLSYGDIGFASVNELLLWRWFMAEMVEIHMIFPRELKILLPKRLFEELDQVVKEETISEIITEAIAEELKKLRFRKHLEQARGKAVL
jgi:hypothetical protein